VLNEEQTSNFDTSSIEEKLAQQLNCESSFRKLKLIKKYFQSVLNQEHIYSLGIMSIKQKLEQQMNYDGITGGFTSIKTRKAHF
jgi:hypothetical protein